MRHTGEEASVRRLCEASAFCLRVQRLTHGLFALRWTCSDYNDKERLEQIHVPRTVSPTGDIFTGSTVLRSFHVPQKQKFTPLVHEIIQTITRSAQLPYWAFFKALRQTGLFLGFFSREIGQFRIPVYLNVYQQEENGVPMAVGVWSCMNEWMNEDFILTRWLTSALLVGSCNSSYRKNKILKQMYNLKLRIKR